MNNETPKSSKVFILDTNVILHDSSCIYKFQEHDIIVPIQVIEELDEFKKGNDVIHFHAREFSRFLDEKSTDHIFNGGISLGDGMGKIKISLTYDFNDYIKRNLKNQNVDAEIINTAYTIQKSDEYKDKEIIIVSKDVNLRMKAKALGIIAQNFLSDAIENVETLSEKPRIIEIDSTKIDELYKRNDGLSLKINDCYENQCIIFKSKKGDSKEKSAIAFFRGGLFYKINKNELKPFKMQPKNSEQTFGINALLDPSLSIVSLEGKAGTGKTIIALACALQQLKNEVYSAIYFTRETVSMGNKEIGFLPGGIDEKIGPFMNGINDNLAVISEVNVENKRLIKEYQDKGSFKAEPLPYIRGRSLHNVFFIIDEAQNLTPHQMKTIVTRAGEGTKIVLIGDTYQIDSPYLDRRSNGLSYLIQKFKGQKCYAHIPLFKSERSALAELAGTLL
jgi:PhoH-like ATPase